MRDGRTCGPGCNCSNCDNTNRLTTTTELDEVEITERQEDLTAREQYGSELVDDDEDDTDLQMEDLEEDGELYDD